MFCFYTHVIVHPLDGELYRFVLDQVGKQELFYGVYVVLATVKTKDGEFFEVIFQFFL